MFFVQGLNSFLLAECLGTGLGFGFTNRASQSWEELKGRKIKPHEKGILGAITSLVVSTAMQPLEVLQKNMQIQVGCPQALC